MTSLFRSLRRRLSGKGSSGASPLPPAASEQPAPPPPAATELQLLQTGWHLAALLERQSMLVAESIEAARRNVIFEHLSEAEYKVFSQFGEDGILQYLIKIVKIQENEKKFIEFGVENYTEATTRLLLMRNNWCGLVMDASEGHIAFIKSQDYYWRHTLAAVCSFITRENINTLITDAGFGGDIGVLCVDIDGNDYWVWQAITVVNPVIVVAEWNSTFGPEHLVTVPYDPAFERTKYHHTNLCYGASIAALERLGQEKGYALVGSNTAGNNLFFVRRDRLGPLAAKSARQAYVESRFRESRGPDGRLTYLSGAAKQAAIGDALLHDVAAGKTVAASSLFAEGSPAQ